MLFRSQVDKVFCHQVGSAHRKLMLESLALKPSSDFTTVETLGNTGSVALPITMARGVESGYLRKDDRVAMLGIGSGINSVMLAVDWQNSWVKTAAKQHAPHFHSRRVTLDS